MSKKVKVTQEQSDWLDRYTDQKGIDYAIDIQPHRKRPDSPIVDWASSKVAQALYLGYETDGSKVGFSIEDSNQKVRDDILSGMYENE